jgi:hypothetical protein
MRRAACLLGLGAILTAGAAAATPPAPTARQVCHPYKEIAAKLGRAYAETPVSLGLQSNGRLIQVFASQASGSWTIVAITPDGIGCILAVGTSWQQLDPPAAPAGPAT